MQRQILRLKDVVELVGLSKTTIWRRTRAGEFPPGHSVGRAINAGRRMEDDRRGGMA